MVTVHRAHGLRFVIYPNDHEPAHVHAIGDGEARIRIVGANGLPQLLSLHCMSKATARKAMDEVRAEQARLLAEWRRIHGQERR
jgi:hypothetical protein